MVSAVANVIPFESRSATGVALPGLPTMPGQDFADQLKAEAAGKRAKLAEAADKKAGTARMLSETRGDIFYINPYALTVREGWNSRIDIDPANIASIDTLAHEIIAAGRVLEALTVWVEGDEVVVDNGHRRLAATKRAIEVYGAQIAAIPCRPADRKNAEGKPRTDADRLAEQNARNGGKPFTTLEQAVNFARLSNAGWSAERIAKRLGNITPARVAQMLAFMEHTSESLFEMVATGKVSFTQAAHVLQDSGNDAKRALAALQAGQEVANASGRSKVTAKHVNAASGQKKASHRVVVRAIFVAPTTAVEHGAGQTTIRMSNEDYAKFAAAFALSA